MNPLPAKNTIDQNRIHPARNYGIDLLRIVSMFMVCVLHIVGLGGITKGVSIEAGRANYAVTWMMYIVCYGAVDIYALISGYVGYGKSRNPFKVLLHMWLQVTFYSVLITIMFAVLKPESRSAVTLLKSFFPFSSDAYWYFSTYSGLLFLMPVINRMIESWDARMLKKVSLALFYGLWLYGTTVKVWNKDPLTVRGGYSVLWLAILYVIGAIIRKAEWSRKISRRKMIFCGSACAVFTFVWKVILDWKDVHVPGLDGFHEDMWISYTSPTILIMAVIFLLFFASCTIPGWMVRVISYVSPAVFGVYLLHVHPQALQYVINGGFAGFAILPFWKMTLAVLGVSTAIFVCGIAVEKMRVFLFQKTGIDRNADAMLLKLGNVINHKIIKE